MEDDNKPDYQFDGFRIEFSEKIALLPLEAGEDPQLGLPGQEAPKK